MLKPSTFALNQITKLQ